MSDVIKKALTNIDPSPSDGLNVLTTIASFIHHYGVYLRNNGILTIRISRIATQHTEYNNYAYIVSAPDEENYGSFRYNIPDTILGPESICNLLRHQGAKVEVCNQGDDKCDYYLITFTIPE